MVVRKVCPVVRLIPIPEEAPQFSYRSIQPGMLIVFRSARDGRAHLGRVACITHTPLGNIFYCRVRCLFVHLPPGQTIEEEIEQEQIERIVTSMTR